jgi:hypothetical protein
MNRYLILCPIALLAVLSILSCTEVVDINLNSAAPKIIIEASISDQPFDCFVKLSKTVNFNEPNIFPKVTGSTIIISDDSGNTASFTETLPGFYTAPSFPGVTGRKYTLSVTSEGKSYSAASYMNNPIEIDSIWQDKYVLGNFAGGGTIKYVKIKYKDPEGEDNFYRIIQKINSTVYSDIIVDNDQLRDGNNITQEIFSIDPELKTGDTVSIYLQTIDKNVFNYFFQLSQVSGQSFGGQIASPANPITNIDNGALGYFSAYAVRSKMIIIY